MSNFTCSRCGIANIDSPTGYVAGCQHYPPEHTGYVAVSLDGETFDARAFYNGTGWYKSFKAWSQQRAVHPVAWRAVHPVAWRAESVDKTTHFSPQEGIRK